MAFTSVFLMGVGFVVSGAETKVEQTIAQKIDAAPTLKDAPAPDPLKDLSPAILFAASGAANLAVFALLLWMLDRMGAPLLACGVHRHRWFASVVYGLVGIVVWAPATFAATYWVRHLSPQIPGSENPAQTFILTGNGGLAWLAVVFAAGLAAPLIEELVFRGVLQGFLSRRSGPVVGVLVSSVLFGFAHGKFWPDPIPLTILGLGLGLAYARTRSLWASVAMHAGFNLIMIVGGALSRTTG